ncbi:MAG TPA: PhzF family phenazine biosynthesis protein [Terracidiphilus sp.]|jgi:trans-2,3-dihydro-3-hydroxyanthranilate isomerase
MELDYFVADVFSSTALKGNPLAVVMNTANLTTEQMQAVAREFNLSETTFVERRAEEVEQREGVRVRIFTTQEELPFAGHPTLGTASVLRLKAPETVRLSTVTLALNVGAMPVWFQDDGLFGEMTQRDPEFGAELDAKEVARLIGLAEDDLDASLTPQIVSTGTAFAIVALKSHEVLARLKVSQHEATEWLRGRGARWFYVLGPTGCEKPAWRARMQFNGGEDPATGSAAGCAIAYLVRRGAVGSGKRIHLRQGVEMGRPSELYLSAEARSGKVSDVHVGGSTVLVASGRLFLP